MDWSSRLSKEAHQQAPARLHEVMMRFGNSADVVSMHGGLPPAAAFPVTAVDVALADGSTATLHDPHRIVEAQQYNLHRLGHPELLAWCRRITHELQRPVTPVECVLGSGSTAALDAVMSLLLDPGDALVVEEHTFAHALDTCFTPRGYDLVPVAMDACGMRADAMRTALEARRAAGNPLPKAVYLIPTGQNPTGAVMPRERMQAVYEVASEYGMAIVEDDAYYALQWPRGSGDVPGLDLPAHFLSLDTSGIVIRLDTFSKLMGPGLRLGWVSGPAAIVDKLALVYSAQSVGPSSWSQALVHTVLDHWGRPGFERFVCSVQRLYAGRQEAAVAAAHRHLSGVARCTPSRAGMFLWFTLTTMGDASAVIEAAIAQQVAVVPGTFFSAVKRPCPCFRVSFASLEPEQMDEGFRRLRVAIDSAADAADRAAPPT